HHGRHHSRGWRLHSQVAAAGGMLGRTMARSQPPAVSRRAALRLSALLGVSAGLAAACHSTAPTAPTSAPAPAAQPTTAAARPTRPAAPPTAAPPPHPTAAQAAAAAKPASREATLALGVDAESLDPRVTTNAFSLSMMKAMFDTLVHLDNKLEPQPG